MSVWAGKVANNILINNSSLELALAPYHQICGLTYHTGVWPHCNIVSLKQLHLPCTGTPSKNTFYALKKIIVLYDD